MKLTILSYQNKMLSLSLTIQKSVFVIEFCSSPIPMVQCLDIISIHGITADMITSERRENVLETSFYRTVSPSTSLESPATFSPFSIQKVAPTKNAKLFFSLFWSRSFLQSIEREKNGKIPKNSGLHTKKWVNCFENHVPCENVYKNTWICFFFL